MSEQGNSWRSCLDKRISMEKVKSSNLHHTFVSGNSFPLLVCARLIISEYFPNNNPLFTVYLMYVGSKY